MSDKIYIIQPFRYQQPLTKILKQLLKKKYPNTRLKIKHKQGDIQKQKLGTPTNVYFIIYDPQLESWDGLHISKKNQTNRTKIYSDISLNHYGPHQIFQKSYRIFRSH